MIRTLVLAILAPLLLLGCVLAPGKFVSTMTINADRSFAFTYKGEVIAVHPRSSVKDTGDKVATESDKPDADRETKNREIAAALSKEYGYRSVEYKGNGVFLIDYAIAGTLTHHFTFPFNSDAEAMVPFLGIELRANNSVRVEAPGFANAASNQGGGLGGAMNENAKMLDGVFTLDTDAEIVSQNNEDGATAKGNRRIITWRATPLTKDAPMAVLKLRP